MNGLKLVLERAIPSLSTIDLLIILNDIPESISVSKYEDLIPKFSPIEKNELDRKENDWSDEFIVPSEEVQQVIDQSLFLQWYRERILSCESFGYIDDALQLCKHAFQIEDFSALYNNLFLESLLNKSRDQDLTLKQIQEMSEEEILEFILTFKSDYQSK